MVDGPPVGEPVGQEEDPSHGVLAERPCHLLAPLHPAAAEVGPAVCTEALHAVARLASRVGRDPRGGKGDANPVVVVDDGYGVEW